MRRAAVGVLCCAVLLAFGSIANAAASDATLGQIAFTVNVEGETPWDWSTNKDGAGTGPSYTLANGSFTPAGYPTDSYSISWSNVQFDVDPGVSGVWAVTNNSNATQIFTVSIDVPVLAIPVGTLMYGSSTLSLGDANFSGSATLASVGGVPLYAGTVDFATALSLFANPYSHTLTSPPGTYGETDFQGAPPGTIPGGPAVVGFIGISHKFSLSAGDTATFNSQFSVVAVPEPGTGLMLALGLGGLTLRRRR